MKCFVTNFCEKIKLRYENLISSKLHPFLQCLVALHHIKRIQVFAKMPRN